MNERVVTPEMRTWIDQSQGMVRAIATKIFSRLPAHVNYDDLVSYGQIGLMQAAYSFQPDKDVSFQTFAYHRIRGAIYDGLGEMSWTSRGVMQRIRAEKLSAELLEQRLRASQCSVRNQSLSADAGWLVRTTERVAIVHLLTDSGGDGASDLSTIVADQSEPPDESVAHAEVCQLLREIVDRLQEPERTLIRGTYFEGKTLTEVAESLGRSKSWASRLHARILERLADSLAACHCD